MHNSDTQVPELDLRLGWAVGVGGGGNRRKGRSPEEENLDIIIKFITLWWSVAPWFSSGFHRSHTCLIKTTDMNKATNPGYERRHLTRVPSESDSMVPILLDSRGVKQTNRRDVNKTSLDVLSIELRPHPLKGHRLSIHEHNYGNSGRSSRSVNCAAVLQ